MTNDKGTRLETLVARWLQAHGWPYARRIVKKGVRDEGDVILGDGIPVTIECKNTRSINLAEGQKELAVEMRNAGNHWGFTIHKRRGTTDVGEYYAVLPLGVLADILRAALEHRATKAEALDHALATEEFVPRTRRIIRRS